MSEEQFVDALAASGASSEEKQRFAAALSARIRQLRAVAVERPPDASTAPAVNDDVAWTTSARRRA